ncbi:MAG: HNH endonuclease signature motif containing protein [Mycoplasmoidaceae bacterium]
MSKELDNKINGILEIFFDGDRNYLDNIPKSKTNKYFQNPKWWNIDTDIWNALNRLFEKIKRLPDLDEIEIKFASLNKNNNPMFSLFAFGNNITPRNNGGEVAHSTMRQYLQFLRCLEIVDLEDDYVKKIKDSTILKCFNLKHKIFNFLNNHNIVFSIISNATKNAISYIRNFGYSFFLSLLHYYEYDFKNINDKYKYIERVLVKKNGKFFDIKTDYGRSQIEKGFFETYKNSIVKNFKKDKRNLEECIDKLWELIQFNFENQEYFDEVLEELNKNHQMKVERGRFKDNIFNHRLEMGLILSKKDKYTDIVDVEGNNDWFLARFNDLHACHIYEVNKIKLYGDDIGFISTPTNGLMMKSEYHWPFDKGLIYFDNDGNMECRKGDQEYIYNDLRLKKCQIRKEVFNDEMQFFLSKR